MARVKNRQFWESATMNNASFLQYYNRLVELSVAMFEWKNLPETVDPRFLELCLFGDGMCVFFKDEDIGFLALRCMIGGMLNVYNIPTMRTAYASNGYNKPLDETDSVIIFNNFTHTPSTLDVEVFARRMYNFDRTIDVNVNAQKTPVLISCDENQRLTLKNLYMKYEGNEPVIFGDKNINPNALKVFKTDAPYNAENIYRLKTQYWNEALTYLGISNTNIQKKERMISDEVTRNMGGVIASRYCRLEPRRMACEQIVNMFPELEGLECNYREDFREIDDEFVIEGESGEEKIVPVAEDLRTRTHLGGE